MGLDVVLRPNVEAVGAKFAGYYDLYLFCFMGLYCSFGIKL